MKKRDNEKAMLEFRVALGMTMGKKMRDGNREKPRLQGSV